MNTKTVSSLPITYPDVDIIVLPIGRRIIEFIKCSDCNCLHAANVCPKTGKNIIKELQATHLSSLAQIN